MKKMLIAVLFLLSVMAWAEKPKPNPADYIVSVHVQNSTSEYDCDDVMKLCSWMQRLNVLIDGKKYILMGSPGKMFVLHVGDYKAKLAKEDTNKPYEYNRNFEFLFSDGSTHNYYVTGESE
jgi:hypothetical protein